MKRFFTILPLLVLALLAYVAMSAPPVRAETVAIGKADHPGYTNPTSRISAQAELATVEVAPIDSRTFNKAMAGDSLDLSGAFPLPANVSERGLLFLMTEPFRDTSDATMRSYRDVDRWSGWSNDSTGRYRQRP